MRELLQEIINNPLSALLIIGNLVLIESLLSVDNAAVLATMVTELKPAQRKRALKYGILGAYFFRGLCLIFATQLIKVWWLKPLGGFYLLYLFFEFFYKRLKKAEKKTTHKTHNSFYKMTVGRLGEFWATVIVVELMDLAFSIDNVFAAVAFSGNIIIIMTGVFIGILAMRFVAGIFVKLIEKYPFLEVCAYIVIGILSIKLSLSFFEHFAPDGLISGILKSDRLDWVLSAMTISVFMLPVITSLLFNMPKRPKN